MYCCWQVRFEVGYYALKPDIKVIAPWREWDLNSRSKLISYAGRGTGAFFRDIDTLSPNYSICNSGDKYVCILPVQHLVQTFTLQNPKPTPCVLPSCPHQCVAEERGIPVPSSKRGEPPFSMDANLLHISYEGNALEDPWQEPDESMFTRSVSPEQVRCSRYKISVLN